MPNLRLNIELDPNRTGREAADLDQNLRRLIVGQQEAIEQIVNIYQMHLTGLSAPGRPIGNFLFLGPTGSGKTRIVEATAESLVKNPKAVFLSRVTASYQLRDENIPPKKSARMNHFTAVSRLRSLQGSKDRA